MKLDGEDAVIRTGSSGEIQGSLRQYWSALGSRYVAVFAFLKKLASSSLLTCLSSKQATLSELRDEWLSSYVEMIVFLLSTHATDYDIERVVKHLESFKRVKGHGPTESAK